MWSAPWLAGLRVGYIFLICSLQREQSHEGGLSFPQPHDPPPPGLQVPQTGYKRPGGSFLSGLHVTQSLVHRQHPRTIGPNECREKKHKNVAMLLPFRSFFTINSGMQGPCGSSSGFLCFLENQGSKQLT